MSGHISHPPRRRRRPLTIAIGIAAVSLVASLVSAPAAHAAPKYLIDAWDYPADLHASSTTTLGQSLEIPDDGTSYDLVGGRFANYNDQGTGLVLTLKAGGPMGAVVASSTFTTLQDNSWVAVQADEALEPGTYYLEASQPQGPVAWWSLSADAYPTGTAWVNESAVAGDRTAFIDSTIAAIPPLEFVGRVATMVDGWDHPADSHGTGTASLGQSLTIPAGTPPVDTVGGRFANYSGEGDGFTMTLREDGPSGAIVAAKTVTDLGDNVWLGITSDEPLAAGEYYLEVSAPRGPVAWWTSAADVYTGGNAFRNGAATSGDRTVFVRKAPLPPVEQSGFTAGVADGMTFESEGMFIRRMDTSGFAYDYAPTVIVDGGVAKAWWCGHNFGGDGIYYSERHASSGWSEPELVLTADQEWETTHACDPSVVQGDFAVDGVGYAYLMYYGAADLSGQNTKIGRAFSHDGMTWVKPADEPLLEEPGLYYDYGVGMPALFTIDDQVYTVYYDTGRNSATILREVERDGTLGTHLRMLPHAGGDTIADVAFSQAEDRWYLATKSQQQHNGDAETYVYRSLTDDLETTEWVYLGAIGEHLTGFALNHNAGWFRTPDGSLSEPGGVKTLAFGAQDDLDSVANPNAWDLAAVEISGSPLAPLSGPGPFALAGPGAGSIVDPLDVDGFAWSAAEGATSYTLRVGTDPSLSADTVVLSTTVHPSSTQTLPTVYDTGSSTQRIAFAPDQTYYWNVTAVNPAGATVSSGARTFSTTSEYSLDLSSVDGYTPWRVVGNATFTGGSPAAIGLPDAQSALRTGRDYNPTRIAIGALDAVEIEFADGSDPAALGELTIAYRLQEEPRNTPVRTVTVDVGDQLNGSTLTVDMTGQPGWLTPGSQLAELTFRTSDSGTLSVDAIRIVRNGVHPDDESGAPALAALTTTSGWATGQHDGSFAVQFSP